MGRGEAREQSSTVALRAETFTEPVSSPGFTNVLASRAHTVFPPNDETVEFVNNVQAAAESTAAGRGGRFFLSARDFIQSRHLIESNDSAEVLLGESMMRNSIWHLGRLMASHSPDSDQLYQFRELLASSAPSACTDLQQVFKNGLLPDELDADYVNELQQNMGNELVQAFATKRGPFSKKGDRRPPMNAISILARISAVKSSIEEAAVTDDDAGQMAKRELAELNKMISRCHNYLLDEYGTNGTSDEVTRTGPGTLTRIEAFAAALISAQETNAQIHADGTTDRYRNMVEDLTGVAVDTPVVAIADRRWLDQINDYGIQLVEQSHGGIDAIHTRNAGILLSPKIADQVVHSSDGSFCEVLAHELVHDTQPTKSKGKALADKAHPLAAPFAYRHQYFELALLEGSTQALANHLNISETGWEGTSQYYPAFTTLVETLGDASPLGRIDFVKELSSKPTNSRAAFIANHFTGSADEDAVRNMMEPLLSDLVEHEDLYAAHGMSQNVVQRQRSSVAEFIARI